MNELRGDILLNSLLSSIQLGGNDTIIYIGTTRIWPPGLLTNFVTEDDIQIITEDTEIRMYYDELTDHSS